MFLVESDLRLLDLKKDNVRQHVRTAWAEFSIQYSYKINLNSKCNNNNNIFLKESKNLLHDGSESLRGKNNDTVNTEMSKE